MSKDGIRKWKKKSRLRVLRHIHKEFTNRQWKTWHCVKGNNSLYFSLWMFFFIFFLLLFHLLPAENGKRICVHIYISFNSSFRNHCFSQTLTTLSIENKPKERKSRRKYDIFQLCKSNCIWIRIVINLH